MFYYYRRVFELQNEDVNPGVYKHKRTQTPTVKLKYYNVPSILKKCFWQDNAKLIM